MPIMLRKSRKKEDARIIAIMGEAQKVWSLRRIVESEKYLPLDQPLKYRFLNRFFEASGVPEVVGPKEICQPRYEDELAEKADEMIRELYETCTKGGLELVPFADYKRDPLTKRLRNKIVHKLEQEEKADEMIR